MEIRIGILHAPREVTIDTVSSLDDVQSAVDAALNKGTTLRLADDKGRVVLVPAAHIAYVEIAGPESRRVGF
jgi:hypothetical protein